MSDDITGLGWLTLTRRNLLKGLVAVPVLGGFVLEYLKKRAVDEARRQAIMSELGVTEGPAVIANAISRPPGKRVRLGIIGFGGEGESLVRFAGFAHPDWIADARKRAEQDARDKDLEVYLAQDDLNIEFTAACDLFDVRADRAVAASCTELRSGGAKASVPAKRYRHYADLLDSGEVDGVIIATPDHWHSRITIAAASQGIPVYCEKCMTRTEPEAHAVYDAVKRAGIAFQLGHQNRQTESYLKAREITDANILGPITLVESTTNRNSKWGAWVWDIDAHGNPETIDWAQFQDPAPTKLPFTPERFFRWRCWWDYGTGLAGDLLSHEYDAVNMVLGLGIPRSAVASGGIYYFKDGRNVPDVFQVSYEYPDRNLTFVYSATLANGNNRGLQFMGHDGTMRVSEALTVLADGESTRYEQKLKDGLIDPSRPMFTYRPGFKGVDAITSATAEYFASRGLLYTYRGGRRVSAYHLHIAEWVDAIRNGGPTSCNIERGFEEAITCHMATRSFLEGRRVEWDPVKRRIV
jgi:predicted dehydrogenase